MSFTYNKVYRKLTRSYILNIVNKYGYCECGDLSAFLDFVCRDESLHLNEYRFIYTKIQQCIKSNALNVYTSGNNTDIQYFKELSELQYELEFVMSLSNFN